jgi:hypothetical protein
MSFLDISRISSSEYIKARILQTEQETSEKLGNGKIRVLAHLRRVKCQHNVFFRNAAFY